MSSDVKRAVGRLGRLGLAIGLLVGGATARADDGEIRRRVESQLQATEHDQEASTDVAVDAGRAVLTGITTTTHDGDREEQAAGEEADAVDNQLRVFPGGEQNAADVAESISSDPRRQLERRDGTRNPRPAPVRNLARSRNGAILRP